MLFNCRLTGTVNTKQMHHAGTTNVCRAVTLAAERWFKYECANQQWTRRSPFISSFPGERKPSCLLNELFNTTTFLGHSRRSCGCFPVFVCWKKRNRTQSNHGYEPVYICTPLTFSYSDTASGSRREATEGNGMARVDSSRVQTFRYSIEIH